MIALVALAAAGLSAADLTLRGGAPTPAATVLRVDLDGVAVVWPDRSPPQEVLSLDRVRRVEGRHADEWASIADVATTAWRAMSRLERGDAVAAEPMLENLFAQYRGRSGPTAARIAEGLLRCRLKRHAYAAAVEPWLVWSALADPDESLPLPFNSLGSRELRLLASLPPIWGEGGGAQAVTSAAASVQTLPSASPSLKQAAEMYAVAARFESDKAPVLLPPPASADPALAFLREIVGSRVGDAPTRREARTLLTRRLRPDAPGWIAAWCRTALGRSLLMEPGDEERRRGIVELTAVHALHGSDQPYLAGLALAEAANACETLADLSGAATLRRELVDTYPGHPSITPHVLRNAASRPSPAPRADSMENE